MIDHTATIATVQGLSSTDCRHSAALATASSSDCTMQLSFVDIPVDPAGLNLIDILFLSFDQPNSNSLFS